MIFNCKIILSSEKINKVERRLSMEKKYVSGGKKIDIFFRF